MPTNTGEARELKDRANANEAEAVRESKTLARKAKAALNKRKAKAALNKTRKAPPESLRSQDSKPTK